MRTGPIQILPLKPCGDAGIWTRGLLHAKQALYRWATSPAVELAALKDVMFPGRYFLPFEVTISSYYLAADKFFNIVRRTDSTKIDMKLIRFYQLISSHGSVA